MTLRPGDIAPDFEQNTTLGRIRFHKRLGNSWGVLFSHPADFTPVCTTELGLTAKLEKEFHRCYRISPAICARVTPLQRQTARTAASSSRYC